MQVHLVSGVDPGAEGQVAPLRVEREEPDVHTTRARRDDRCVPRDRARVVDDQRRLHDVDEILVDTA